MKTLIRILTLCLVFIALSCTAQKQVQVTSRAETTTHEDMTIEAMATTNNAEMSAGESTALVYENTIPAEESTLTLNDSQLQALPDGAEYTASDGRASTTVKRDGNSYAITTRCAEVNRKYIYYRNEAYRLRNEVNALSAELLQKKTTIENQLPQLIPKLSKNRLLQNASNGFQSAFC